MLPSCIEKERKRPLRACLPRPKLLLWGKKLDFCAPQVKFAIRRARGLIQGWGNSSVKFCNVLSKTKIPTQYISLKLLRLSWVLGRWTFVKRAYSRGSIIHVVVMGNGDSWKKWQADQFIGSIGTPNKCLWRTLLCFWILSSFQIYRHWTRLVITKKYITA